MAFNFIQNKMEKSIKNVQKRGILNKENIEEVLSELRLSLLESDVNLNVVKSFIDSVYNKSIGSVVDFEKTSSQEILKIINNELISILGKETKEWTHSSGAVVMFVGLQGSGKTTSLAKLAHYTVSKNKSKKPLLVGLDVYRPAAIDQLEKLANDNSFDFYSRKDTKDVSLILDEALAFAKENNNDLILLDTAGRLQTDDVLMEELEMIKKTSKPSEIIFVADGFSGQEIVNVAEEFNKRIKISSAIITKLDSDAKGGAALSIASILGVPIRFAGIGEKVTDFELFHPDRMASRILGLGDIDTLTEKAAEISDEKQQERMFRKMLSGKFDMVDLLESMEMMAKMGNISGVAKMIPGLSKLAPQSEGMEEKLEIYKILISSMTKREQRSPKLLNLPKRKERIMKGSGRTPQEFNELLRKFEQMQKQMKKIGQMIKSGRMPNLNDLSRMGGGF